MDIGGGGRREKEWGIQNNTPSFTRYLGIYFALLKWKHNELKEIRSANKLPANFILPIEKNKRIKKRILTTTQNGIKRK